MSLIIVTIKVITLTTTSLLSDISPKILLFVETLCPSYHCHCCHHHLTKTSINATPTSTIVNISNTIGPIAQLSLFFRISKWAYLYNTIMLLVRVHCNLCSSEYSCRTGGSSGAYLIFVIFSPRAQFCVRFFSTQKRVNRD